MAVGPEPRTRLHVVYINGASGTPSMVCGSRDAMQKFNVKVANEQHYLRPRGNYDETRNKAKAAQTTIPDQDLAAYLDTKPHSIAALLRPLWAVFL